MALHIPTFLTRLGSSIVFATIMLTGLLWNEWAFLTLVCLMNILCLRDYFRLMQKIDKEAHWPKWLPVAVQVTSLLFISVNIYAGLIVLFCVPAILLLASVLSKKNALLAMLQSTGGLLYITLPMFLLYSLRQHNFILPLALILMIWCNDTMAYLVGSFLGKNPLSSVSPKKTWEGTIGGALLTIIGAGIFGYYTNAYHLIDWIMLALCATVAGTFGDLLESKLKRMADVKDSGTLMPGHGGALDRFDSLLIAAPFAFVYVTYFMR